MAATIEKQPAEAPLGVCAWCAEPLSTVAERLPGRIRCTNCGVANTYPWPDAAQLDAAYGGWYRPSSGRFSGVGDVILRRTRSSLARRLDKIAPPGPVLDVGAGDGALIDALAAHGREALGLEREATRSKMRAAEVTEIEGSWAAIVFWHSLEHLPNPAEAIEHAASLLRPRGVLVLALPNVGSMQAHLFGSRWLALDLPRHLVHLSSRDLVERLRMLSLDVERISHWRGGQVVFGWLHGMVGTLPGHPDLYDAIRRPEARRSPRSGSARTTALVGATLLAPFAVLATFIEIVLGRGGTVYVEARHV